MSMPITYFCISDAVHLDYSILPKLSLSLQIPCPVCRTELKKCSLKVDGVDTDKYISEKVSKF